MWYNPGAFMPKPSRTSKQKIESVLHLPPDEDHFSVTNPSSTSWKSFVKPFLKRVLQKQAAEGT